MSRTVADIMTTELVTFLADDNIEKALHTLLEKNISGAPVIDDSGGLIGILSRKDCLKVAYSALYHDSWGGLVRDHMVHEVHTLDAGLSLAGAAQKFLDTPFHRYPVMRDGQMVGLICRHDILNALNADLLGRR